MATLVFGMMQSLDGYVADAEGGLKLFPPPGPLLCRHFNNHVRTLAGTFYGRRMYEVMRYWDQDQPGWDANDHEFAEAWRALPKWVASRTLNSVGPNATLISGDVDAYVRRLKSAVDGEIDVAGPELAGALSDLGLIHLYFRPFVLGGGKPYFTGPRPPLRLIETRMIGEEAIKIVLVPA